jgi:hypothetical protein
VTVGRAAVAAVGAVVIFVAGVGLGQSLDDNDVDGAATQTLVRTLEPLSLAPAARTTITVTTTAAP